MSPVHLGLMLVDVVDEDSLNIVLCFVPSMLRRYVHSVDCDMSHERDWLLTLYHLDCFSTCLQMWPVHLGLMLEGLFVEDSVKIVYFVHTIAAMGTRRQDWRQNQRTAMRIQREQDVPVVCQSSLSASGQDWRQNQRTAMRIQPERAVVRQSSLLASGWHNSNGLETNLESEINSCLENNNSV
jgi:hypothetical protein